MANEFKAKNGISTPQLTSTVATGTAPLTVTSTTRVSNLNVATAGTADTWTTGRTITIGATGKSVNGSANVSWTTTEIGATTVGSNLFTLTNPGAITFLRINANNTVTAQSAANFRTDIGATTVGSSLFTLTNPGAVTFLRVNADNTVSALSASAFLTAIGGISVAAEYNAGNSGTALTVNWSNGASQKVTLTGNVTFTFSNPVAGYTYKLKLIQGAGPFTVVWPTIKWAGAAAPTLTTTNAAVDIISLYYDGTTYYGMYGLNFA